MGPSPVFGLDELLSDLTELAVGRVGVSARFTRLDDAPEARRQARVACNAATPEAAEVRRFDEDPLAVLLASSPEYADRLVDAVLAPVLALPPSTGPWRWTRRVRGSPTEARPPGSPARCTCTATPSATGSGGCRS